MTTTEPCDIPVDEQLGLAEELAAIYARARALVGGDDVAYIRHVAAYADAIKKRSRYLLAESDGPAGWVRGTVLSAIYTTLMFSELGHNILHGCYDGITGAEDLDSRAWRWDGVNVDVGDWQTMHHQNHHPYTNIRGKDHDLGYSVVRLHPGQDWSAHHLIQAVVLAPLALPTLSSFFGVFAAGSAAATNNMPVLAPKTFTAISKVVVAQMKRDYLLEPWSAGPMRFLPVLIGNHVGIALGHLAIFAQVVIEHHAPNVEVFADPGPGETVEEYFRRQILATTNFVTSPTLDGWLARQLADVDFVDPPPPHVLYGGLDTHIEHHLFPDLPPNRQRQISSEVAAVCARHGLPYNVFSLEDYVRRVHWQTLLRNALPVAAGEKVREVFTRPARTLARVAAGLNYWRRDRVRFAEVPAKVVAAPRLGGGDVRVLRLARPAGWQHLSWFAGAHISVRVPDGRGSTVVRQYSLLRASDGGAAPMEIAVKRVAGGLGSTFLVDSLEVGQTVTVVAPPSHDPGFVLAEQPDRAVFIAAGIGITPLLAMLRTIGDTVLGADAVLVYANSDDESVLFEAELSRLARRARIGVHHVRSTTRVENGVRQGRISADLLVELVPDIAQRHVWMCAPEPLMDQLAGWCADWRIPPERMHRESFSVPQLRAPTDTGARHQVRFTRTGTTVVVDESTTVLDAARGAGIAVPTGCERGVCRTCVTTVASAHSGGAVREPLCTRFVTADLVVDA